MGRLQGKTAVITGGNSGMGLATAEAMVREGARVMIAGRNPETLRKAQEKLGSSGIAVECAVDRLADIDRLAERAAKEYGKVDIVFANAGAGHSINMPAEQVDEAVYEEGMGANLKGKFFTITRLSPLMGEGGSVILTGGITNHVHIQNCVLLSVVQASARALARSLAVEFAPRGIRVNCLCPGFIYGPIYDGMDMEALDQAYIQRIPLKRMGTGREIADTVVFLGSDEASYITGTEIVVDGGHTLPI